MKLIKTETPSASEIIDRIGGTAAVAELCEVKSPSVSEWRHKGIPKARLQFLRLARPDVSEQTPDRGASRLLLPLPALRGGIFLDK